MAEEIEIRVGKKWEMGNRKRVGEKKGKKRSGAERNLPFGMSRVTNSQPSMSGHIRDFYR